MLKYKAKPFALDEKKQVWRCLKQKTVVQASWEVEMMKKQEFHHTGRATSRHLDIHVLNYSLSNKKWWNCDDEIYLHYIYFIFEQNQKGVSAHVVKLSFPPLGGRIKTLSS